jgi:hypothetical protein
MAIVSIDCENPNKKGEQLEYYIDDRLKSAIDKNIKPALKDDDDYILCLDGKERSGKSTLAMQIGKYIDSTLDLNRICFSADEFKTAILNAKKGQCVIFDEAYRGYGSASALSEVNRLLKAMMMEMGQKNLFVIVVLPTFYLLDRYVALWRARCLIHTYKLKGVKGYFRVFNQKKKQELYLDPKCKKYFNYSKVKTEFKGRFYGKYTVNEVKYRDKKNKTFKEGYKVKKGGTYIEQRDILINILHKEVGYTQEKISKLLKQYNTTISQQEISKILAKSREHTQK